jgi:hypothetical protein
MSLERPIAWAGSSGATIAGERTDAQQSQPPPQASSVSEPMFDCTNTMIVRLFYVVKWAIGGFFTKDGVVALPGSLRFLAPGILCLLY